MTAKVRSWECRNVEMCNVTRLPLGIDKPSERLAPRDRSWDPNGARTVCDRLALRVQSFAALPGEEVLAQLAVERPDLVVFGHRRKAHDVPIRLRHHVARSDGGGEPAALRRGRAVGHLIAACSGGS